MSKDVIIPAVVCYVIAVLMYLVFGPVEENPIGLILMFWAALHMHLFVGAKQNRPEVTPPTGMSVGDPVPWDDVKDWDSPPLFVTSKGIDSRATFIAYNPVTDSMRWVSDSEFNLTSTHVVAYAPFGTLGVWRLVWRQAS